MSYKILEDANEVEVKEIVHGGYFEWYNKVYQRVGIDANLRCQLRPDGNIYPIFSLDLNTDTLCYFSDEGKTIVRPLYKKSPLVLTRAKP